MLHLRQMLKGIKVWHLKGVVTWLLIPHPAAVSSTRTQQLGAGWGGFHRRQQGQAVSLVTRRAAPFQVAQEQLGGTGQPSWTSQSAKPYKERLLKPGTICRAVGKGAGQQDRVQAGMSNSGKKQENMSLVCLNGLCIPKEAETGILTVHIDHCIHFSPLQFWNLFNI